jgi:hypothetical protein
MAECYARAMCAARLARMSLLRWRRFGSAVFLLWFSVLVAAPTAVHWCPIHDAPMAAMDGGSMHGDMHDMSGMPASDDGADSHHGDSNSSPHGAHHCTCLGESCASTLAGLPGAASHLALPSVRIVRVAAILEQRDAPSFPADLRLPFPNGPPPRA